MEDRHKPGQELAYQLMCCLGAMDYQKVHDLGMQVGYDDLLRCFYQLYNKNRQLAKFILESRVTGQPDRRLPPELLDKSQLPDGDLTAHQLEERYKGRSRSAGQQPSNP